MSPLTDILNAKIWGRSTHYVYSEFHYLAFTKNRSIYCNNSKSRKNG